LFPYRLAEFNPKLQEVSAATRVAYAKFKTKVLIRKSDAADQEEGVEPNKTPQGTPQITPQLTPQLAHRVRSSSKKKQHQSLRFDGEGNQVPSSLATKSMSRGTSAGHVPDLDITPIDETPILKPIRLHAEEILVTKAPDENLDAIHTVSENTGDEAKSTERVRMDLDDSVPQDIIDKTSSTDKGEKPADYTVVQVEARQVPSGPEGEGSSRGSGAEERKTDKAPDKGNGDKAGGGSEEKSGGQKGEDGDKNGGGDDKKEGDQGRKGGKKDDKVEETEEEKEKKKKMEEEEKKKEEKAKRRKSSAASLTPASAAGDDEAAGRRRSSAFATGKSAITGQTRTGWL